MPPKTQPPAKTQPGRSVKKVSFQAQTLDQVSLTRARLIASAYKIPYYSKISPEDIIPAIRERMLLVRQCAPCGNAQCDPDQHVFQATAPLADPEGSGSDVEENTPADREASPNARVLRDLNKAVNPGDNPVSVTQDFPSFLDHLAGASGSGLPTVTTPPGEGSPRTNFDDFNTMTSPGLDQSITFGTGDGTSPLSNQVQMQDGSGSEDEEEAAFQAQVTAEKQKIQDEVNRKREAINKQADQAARAKQIAAQQKKESDAAKVAKRKQIWANLEAQRNAALLALDEQARQQQAGYVTDEVFAETANVESSRSDSARPPLPSTGVDMSLFST